MMIRSNLRKKNGTPKKKSLFLETSGWVFFDDFSLSLLFSHKRGFSLSVVFWRFEFEKKFAKLQVNRTK